MGVRLRRQNDARAKIAYRAGVGESFSCRDASDVTGQRLKKMDVLKTPNRLEHSPSRASRLSVRLRWHRECTENNPCSFMIRFPFLKLVGCLPCRNWPTTRFAHRCHHFAQIPSPLGRHRSHPCYACPSVTAARHNSRYWIP